MEINRIDIEKPQEVVWSNTSDGQELGQAVRSFRCTFCKRGFSNAQALGGHMNVHRKDRARLKGSLDGTLFPMDVMKKSPSSDHPPASQDDHDHLLQPEPSDDHDKKFAHKRPWIFSEEDEESPRRKDGFKEVLQLPLCVESSSSTNDLGTSSCADGHEGKSIQLRQPSSSTEVDLELRLGTEPKGRS